MGNAPANRESGTTVTDVQYNNQSTNSSTSRNSEIKCTVHTSFPLDIHRTKLLEHAAADPKKSVVHSRSYQLEMKVDDWNETVYSNYHASIDLDYTLLTLRRISPAVHLLRSTSTESPPHDILRLELDQYAASSLKPIWSNLQQLDTTDYNPSHWRTNLRKLFWKGPISQASIRFPGCQKERAKNFLEDLTH